MPKITRSAEEIARVRKRILGGAIELMAREGFRNLSMRKLAARLGMTAANIYNYYHNKDELYLDIQTDGFLQIRDRFIAALGRPGGPRERILAVMKEYIAFGTGNPDCYNIIFSMDTPKYADYRGTDIEPTALAEKKAGLALIDITIGSVRELLTAHGRPAESAWDKTVQLWIMLHGIVSLVNSRVLQEVAGESPSFIEATLKDVADFIVA